MKVIKEREKIKKEILYLHNAHHRAETINVTHKSGVTFVPQCAPTCVGVVIPGNFIWGSEL